MQLLIFVESTNRWIFQPGVKPVSPLMGLWWAQMDFLSFGCFATKWQPHFSHTCTLSGLVGSNGLGPSTSRLSGVCSNQLSYEPIYGGGNRVRTDDPLLAGQVLYQLSYTPIPSLFAK